jgi:hypothetical protein
MTFVERVAAVQALGFMPRQAAFLTTVALFSGYCLRRQYAAFIGRNQGQLTRDFLDRLVDRSLARRITYRAHRGSIYHVFGRRLYAAIGEENNRNRRHASPPLTARKLMLFDFVLAHRDLEWYATEADKVDLFVNRLGLPEAVLPQRTYTPRTPHSPLAPNTTRYWIQKLPIFLRGAPPIVNFVCIITDPHASSIGTFVREHAPLLRHVPTWALNALIPQRVATVDACQTAYHRALAAASLSSMRKEDLEWFDRTRQLVSRGELRDLAVGDLTRYRELAALVPRRLDVRSAGPLVLQWLPHSYSQFGSFAGIV